METLRWREPQESSWGFEVGESTGSVYKQERRREMPVRDPKSTGTKRQVFTGRLGMPVDVSKNQQSFTMLFT